MRQKIGKFLSAFLGPPIRSARCSQKSRNYVFVNSLMGGIINDLNRCPALEDERQINLLHSLVDKPMVQVLTRPKYNFNKIKEGDNVSLECSVKANPAVNAVRWFHNVSIFVN